MFSKKPEFIDCIFLQKKKKKKKKKNDKLLE